MNNLSATNGNGGGGGVDGAGDDAEHDDDGLDSYFFRLQWASWVAQAILVDMFPEASPQEGVEALLEDRQ